MLMLTWMRVKMFKNKSIADSASYPMLDFLVLSVFFLLLKIKMRQF